MFYYFVLWLAELADKIGDMSLELVYFALRMGFWSKEAIF